MAIEDAYELAYREAVRTLDHQLAAASVTVSLPGVDPLGANRAFAWLAVAAFVLLSICVLTIVWPRGDWHFDTNPHDLLAKHLGSKQVAAARLSLDLIVHMTEDQRANGLRLLHIARAFRAGACLLVIQILSSVAAASNVI